MLRHVLRQSRRGQQAKRAISLSRRKGKSAPSFSLPRSTSETDRITFPCAAPHPLNTCFLSKLPNFTSHQVQSQLNNPRKSHSSGALQHTGSDTCGWSSSSFLGAGLRRRGLFAEPLTVRQVRPVGTRLPEGTNHEAERLWRTAAPANGDSSQRRRGRAGGNVKGGGWRTGGRAYGTRTTQEGASQWNKWIHFSTKPEHEPRTWACMASRVTSVKNLRPFYQTCDHQHVTQME